MDTNIEKLYEDLPDEAIQITKKEKTKKGYDTAGYSYQYCVDRLNEVYGPDWGYSYHIVNTEKGQYHNSGIPYIEITVDLEIWVGNKENSRTCAGGHTSSNFTDAYKGAITNAFKKTAAFWGVGARAFRGELDPDNKELPGSDSNKIPSGKKFDFDEIKSKLGGMEIGGMVEYWNELEKTGFQSDSQKEALRAIFKKEREFKENEKAVESIDDIKY